jgi:GNAT superfamily N-acetyltransferase
MWKTWMKIMSDLDNEVVVCRPALAMDKEDVMELCSHIWEGDDYIPLVWDEWLADPDGLLGVAEISGRVAGVFKLTKFKVGEWYMEGLRVHPDYQGKGVASHIHEFVLETWRRMGSGIIRLTTGSYNVKVHRMCEKSGFKRIAEFIPYRAPILMEGTDSFIALKPLEAPDAMEFVVKSKMNELSSGLINLGWVYADPQIKHIERAIKDGHAWWWKGGLGFISIWEDDKDEEHAPGLELIACPVNELGGLLMDYRRLMGAIGYKTAGWTSPNRPEVITAIEKAGFERSWDVSIYIFELSA